MKQWVVFIQMEDQDSLQMNGHVVNSIFYSIID